MRGEHEFEFTADKIAEAAKDEAAYHEARVEHWTDRRDVALKRVKATVSAEVVEQQITGGVRAGVVVKYGDPEAWSEYQLAFDKVNEHRAAADRFQTDARLYGTQQQRSYRLDAEDVHHFRLGGQPRVA